MADTTTEKFKAIIIGSGQAGDPLAKALAEEGWTVALIEREHLGGSCVNEGCTPTKAMVASARVSYLARNSLDYGIHAAHSVDMEAVWERKERIVKQFRNGLQKQFDKTDNLTLFAGEAKFKTADTVEIKFNNGKKKSIKGETIFINTGTRPTIPPIDGLDNVPYLTSKSILELKALPNHLVIVGGGYIGLEFAQMFRRFGSDVTLIQRGNQLLSLEDADVANAVLEIIDEDGINVELNASPTRVEVTSDGAILLTIKNGKSEKTIAGSHLLLATGRIPNTDALELDKAKVETDEKGYIIVTDKLETSTAHIYALGDVKGGPAFTHISYDDFRVVRDNLLLGKDRSIKDRMVPYTVFIDPQLGRIGLSEKEATKQKLKFRVAKLGMDRVARAIEMGETRGFMKALVDEKTDKIIGAAILGIEGGEIMSAIQIAMMGQLPYTALRDGIFAHPTLIESLNNLFMKLDKTQ